MLNDSMIDHQTYHDFVPKNAGVQYCAPQRCESTTSGVDQFNATIQSRENRQETLMFDRKTPAFLYSFP